MAMSANPSPSRSPPPARAAPSWLPGCEPPSVNEASDGAARPRCPEKTHTRPRFSSLGAPTARSGTASPSTSPTAATTSPRLGDGGTAPSVHCGPPGGGPLGPPNQTSTFPAGAPIVSGEADPTTTSLYPSASRSVSAAEAANPSLLEKPCQVHGERKPGPP